MPEHLRVAESASLYIQDRIAPILCPRSSPIQAVGDRLRLPGVDSINTWIRVCRDHRRISHGAKPGSIVPVDDYASRTDALAIAVNHTLYLGDGQWQLLPVHQVSTNCVTPYGIPHINKFARL